MHIYQVRERETEEEKKEGTKDEEKHLQKYLPKSILIRSFSKMKTNRSQALYFPIEKYKNLHKTTAPLVLLIGEYFGAGPLTVSNLKF